mmetsp:Transcript_35623/g.93584  ORF Transcript_35623/g.93584 Transcript_35623/m.93584 type:complete len:124 (-) Transcript_35623:322-693(-)
MLLQQQQQQAQQAAAPAAAPAPMEMAQMETMQIDEQPTSAAPRVAAAAAPHKRQAVAAVAAAVETGGGGGKPPAGGEGTWNGGTLTAPDGYARRERDRRRNPRAMPGHGEPRRERWDVEHVRE